MQSRSHKMSKSRGNVVNPDDVVDEYGADSLRLYEMFMGPLEAVKPWSTRSVEGVHRFLSRSWRLIAADEDAPEAQPPGRNPPGPLATAASRTGSRQRRRAATTSARCTRPSPR